MKEQNYKAGLTILQPSIVELQFHGNVKQLILAFIKKVHYLLIIKRIEDGQSTDDMIIAMIEKENFHDGNEMEKYFNEIRQVIEKAAENLNPKLFFSLHHALVQYI